MLFYIKNVIVFMLTSPIKSIELKYILQDVIMFFIWRGDMVNYNFM